MTQPFGEDLWKNVQAVRVTRDGGIEVPVQADSDGIRVGVDAVPVERATAPGERSRFGSFVRRLVRRRRTP